MSNLICRGTALAISLLIAQSIGTAGQAAERAAAAAWGFDLAGADFAKNPGDDFFRYGNGAWYDRAVIPRDRSSIGVDTALIIAIGIGGSLAAPPLPHHLAYGSVPRRFEKLR